MQHAGACGALLRWHKARATQRLRASREVALVAAEVVAALVVAEIAR